MKRRILVADGDAQRGQRIAAACTDRGLICRVTTHGAAALEVALGEVPDALVAQLDLPLIEGAKLASILRANPRTQGIGVVFLGDRPGDAERHGVVGQVVPHDAAPEVVAGCVQTELGARAGQEAAVEDGGVEGELSQLPLADLLQLFQVSRKTGTVEVARGLGRSRRELGRIHLREGEIVAATVGAVGGEKALFRLLTWDRGGFAFKPGAPDVEASIRTPTRSLLREGQRQLEEWQRLAVELPPLSATVNLTIPRAALPNVIHPLTQEVLVVLDLYSRVQDVVDHCTYPDYQVLRTLHTLAQRGMVELEDAGPVPELAGDAPLFPAARVSRLREWLDVDRPGAGAGRDAKLLVVSREPGSTAGLLRLLERLPGWESEAAWEEGAPGDDDLLPLGRLAVDDELSIEWLHVPSNERFAPIWPVAAHGALAIVVVSSGAVGEAQRVLAPVVDALRALPRTRLLTVHLLEKGERLDPEQVGRTLAIADQGSLYLVPQDSPQKAVVLLRELCARILP